MSRALVITGNTDRDSHASLLLTLLFYLKTLGLHSEKVTWKKDGREIKSVYPIRFSSDTKGHRGEEARTHIEMIQSGNCSKIPTRHSLAKHLKR